MTALPDSPLDSARLVAQWGEARDWLGSDPYEGLNATRFVAPLVRRPLGRRVVIQAVKRSAVDLRPILRIPPCRNAAAMADVASAYALGGPDLTPDWEPRLERAVNGLLDLRSPGYDRPCWGYHFDVQTRVFFYPSSSPNTIATAYAGFALLDAFERTGDEALLTTAIGVGAYFTEQVPQTSDPPGAFFGYLPGDRTPIHNASLLACALLARLAERTGSQELALASQAGVDHAIARQRPDGSWPYGEQPHLGWVDNFHTGYVLECLMTCKRAGLDVDVDAIRRGLAFSQRELFLADGTPKYFPSNVYPVDIQCVAQAIKTFALATTWWPEMIAQADRTWGFARERMRRADGVFAFQRGRFALNRVPHVRWGQAPMLRALVELGVRQRTATPAAR